MEYQEKLRDPRWQKKRLEVFNRDNFKCIYCGDENTTLCVHHRVYKGDPWEVDLDDLITCCEHCHSLIEYLKDDWNDLIDLKILKIRKHIKGDFYLFYLVLMSSEADIYYARYNLYKDIYMRIFLGNKKMIEHIKSFIEEAENNPNFLE